MFLCLIYIKEQTKDASQWVDDLRKQLFQKAKYNPTGWQEKFLKRHNGKAPIIHRETPRRITSFLKKLNITETERRLEKIIGILVISVNNLSL